jgi:hypothetical protein
MTVEDFFVIVFVVFLAFAAMSAFFGITVYPICRYFCRRRNNLLQWRCVETWESKVDRLQKQSDAYVCDLEYRILPSELNVFVRIFGSNGWKHAFEKMTFKSKEEFLEFIENFKTYGDISDYLSEENGTLWVHP